jgi:hypothetical protein
VNRTETNRHEERLAKELVERKRLMLPDGTILRLLDYQCPLKSVRADKGVGKIDLVGINEQSLALVELKTKDSKENPRVALLEILTYGAIVRDPKNFEKINKEIVKNTWNPKSCNGVHHIILAPQEYWKRWSEKRPKERWNKFCGLCTALRDSPHKFDIQCLAFKDQDLNSLLAVSV